MTTPRRKRTRTIPASFAPGFLDALDQRFAPTVAARRTYDELVTALGGADSLTPQRRLMVERVVWTHLMLERIEVEFATSMKIEGNVYGQLVHVLVSLLKTLGLNRVATDVPSLSEYLEAKQS